MKDTGILWNDDALLSELEQMQDQAEELLAENQNLRESLFQAQQTISEDSSTISELKNELQSKSEKIIELSGQLERLYGAEQIFQRNRELQTQNRNLSQENSTLKEEAERDKQRFQEWETQLTSREENVTSEQNHLKQREKSLEDTIKRKVDDIVKNERKKLEREMDTKNSEYRRWLEEEFRKKMDDAERLYLYAIIFTIPTVIIAALKNKVWMKDLYEFFAKIAGFIDLVWTWIAGIISGLLKTTGYLETDMCRYSTYLIEGTLVVLMVFIIGWYIYTLDQDDFRPKRKSKVNISMGIVSFLILVYLGDVIQELIPVNLILMSVLLLVGTFLIKSLTFMEDKEKQRNIIISIITLRIVGIIIFGMFFFS